MPESNDVRRNGDAGTTDGNYESITRVEGEPEEEEEGGGFGVSVELAGCVGAETARCRVWVRRAGGRRVRWLAERVRRVARLRGAFLLLAADHLLPPGEPLRLLRRTDTVRVVRVEHEWQHPFSFREDDMSTEPDGAEDKMKHSSIPRPLSPAPRTNPAPKSITRSEPDEMVIVEQTKTCDTLQPVPQYSSSPPPQTQLDDTLQHVKRRALALLQRVAGEENQESIDDVDAPKKRRRRVRRRRPVRPAPLDLPLETPASTSTPEKLLVQCSPLDESQVLPSPLASETALSVPSQDSPVVLQTCRPASMLLPAPPAPPTTIISHQPVPVLRNPTPPRAPRLVRALGAAPMEVTTSDAILCSAD